MGEVFVFVHGPDGRAIGAGPLISTPKRKDLANTLPGMSADCDRNGDPEEVMAVVKSTGLAYHVVPLTQISNFDQHPGYKRQG
jgi:hypothetical protein